MARLAIILCAGSPELRDLRLGRILDFFGVPWKLVEVSKLRGMDCSSLEYAVFGTIRAVEAATREWSVANSRGFQPVAFYTFLDDNRSLCESALQSLSGDANLRLRGAPSGNISISVSNEFGEMAGPMSGLKVSVQLGKEDGVLTGALAGGESKCATVFSAEDDSVFVRFERSGTPIFFIASSQMVDIGQPVGRGFYDVKDHFCSVVPLVMFIRFVFPDVVWRPQELGACLIIDDPLLNSKYGFCDFERLRNLMQGHGFTTNIAFIPWNWRRTSSAASKFFRNESGLFSVSIHGCDHTAGEFGASSIEVLENRAQLALSRMRNHEARTGIQHDAIMVFPQGTFSSASPEVLKHNGFLAAVNTELDPVDSKDFRTRIRDVWDVAIMAYGAFPIFTRRYAFHGLENFAFDLLLGKSCLIVAHHDSFKDGGAAIVDLIERIKSLNCRLRWCPLGQVIRSACRRRGSGTGVELVEMYGNELVIENPTDQAIELRIRKTRNQKDNVSEVLCDLKPIQWGTENDYFVFGGTICPRSEKRYRVVYREQPHIVNVRRSLRFEMAVAIRRILSEFRDNYISKSSYLNAPAEKIRKAFRKSMKNGEGTETIVQ